MSASFQKLDTGQLKISWSTYSAYSMAIVSIEDADSKLKWITRTSGSSLNVKVPIDAVKHQLKVTVTLSQSQSSGGSSTGDGFKVVSVHIATESNSGDLISAFSTLGLSSTLNDFPKETELSGFPRLESSLGIQVNNGEMSVVINRGTVLPCHATNEYTTSVDNQQNGSLSIYQGNAEHAKNNNYIGTCCLAGISPLPKGVPRIVVDMKVDLSGRLTFDADEITSSPRAHVSWTSLHRAIEIDRGVSAYQPTFSIERSTYRQAAVKLPRHLGHVDQWQVTVTKTASYSTTSMIFYIDASTNIYTSSVFEFPLLFETGKRYKVTLVALKKSQLASRQYNYVDSYSQIGEESAEFKADLTVGDLKVLHQRAVTECLYSAAPCTWLYRNKSNAYFYDVFNNHGGLMTVYAKDNSGDPASSINGQIDGLFFLANVEDGSRTGEPRRQSQFGPNRIQIPARVLLELAGNLYFADYYCMRGRIHYVTIVMTTPGSTADNFCREHLLKLDLRDKKENPFFFEEYGQLFVATTLTIELLYTEDIDINYMRTSRGALYSDRIPTIGKGSSTPGGVPKNSNCYSCNIHPPGSIVLFGSGLSVF